MGYSLLGLAPRITISLALDRANSSRAGVFPDALAEKRISTMPASISPARLNTATRSIKVRTRWTNCKDFIGNLHSQASFRCLRCGLLNALAQISHACSNALQSK